VRLSGSLSLTALGSALCFLSALCYSVYLIFSNKLIARIGSMRFTAYAMTVSSFAVIIHFLIANPLTALQLPWQVYSYGAVMAFFCTVLPVFMVSEANRRIGPAQVGILTSVGPVATLLLGFILLGEIITPDQIAGVVLVLAGVWFLSKKPQDSKALKG
jgi:drug/metabolite transporter (DMT)-like permease